jgi:hypothetical protein
LIARDLSQELVLTLAVIENSQHVIFTGRDHDILNGGNSCALSGMSFKNKSKVHFLIPNMNGAVNTSSVANTILIEGDTGERSGFILVFGAESTSSE